MVLNPIKLFSLLNLVIFSHFILTENFTNADSNITQSIRFASKEDKAFLDEFQHILSKYIYQIVSGFLPRTGSTKCLQDFEFIFQSISHAEWPIKMLDSFGKPESGVLNGNLKWVGEFDECLDIYAPPNENSSAGGFHGQYCTLQTTVEMKGRPLNLSMGLCLPDSCKLSEINTNISKNLNFKEVIPGISDKIGSALNTAKMTCQVAPESLSAGAISVIFLISIFTLLAVIGTSITVYEYVIEPNTKYDTLTETNSIQNPSSSDHVESLSETERHSLPMWLEKCRGFFNCFCFITNGERILNVEAAEGQLPCLHGIRFLSMSWVILCHAFATAFRAIRNPAETVVLIDHWSFEVILNGFYSVDSFFVLSAFLVGYLFFKQCAKSDGKIPWLYFYIHRYIRLTPVYIIVVAFYYTLGPHLGTGPIWPDDSANMDPNCKVDWWWNLLYINNFLGNIQSCMGWTWYLANDMQFYIISPLFLVTLWRWPKIGYSVLASFLCITYITSFVITYEFKLITGFGNISANTFNPIKFFPEWSKYFDKFYIKPYTRLDPYLIGIALAYYIFKRKENNSGKLSLVALTIGWAVAVGVTLTCLFGIYHQTPTRVSSSFYNAFNRTGFACGLAWVMFVCISEQGGVVNKILSWKVWIPLSRLTFCAYLIHPIVEIVYFSTVRRLIQYSHTTLLILYLGFLFFSYAFALLASLLFESPVIRLERLMRNKFSS